MQLNTSILQTDKGTYLVLPDGRAFKKRDAMAGLGAWYDGAITATNTDYSQATPTEEKKKINWDGIFSTVDKILSNETVQNLISNVKFDSGQFQFGPGQQTITTTPPPAPAGFNWKPLALIGGGILAAVLIAKAVKPKED